MLINLPNSMIADAIARKLMSYFVVKDKKSGTKILLCEMQADLSTAKINSKYYPITGNEVWLSIFTDERDDALRVARDTVMELKTGTPSNTTLINLAKTVSAIDVFTSVTMSSSRSFDAPDFNTMLNETKEANKNEEDKSKMIEDDTAMPVVADEEEGS